MFSIVFNSLVVNVIVSVILNSKSNTECSGKLYFVTSSLLDLRKSAPSHHIVFSTPLPSILVTKSAGFSFRLLDFERKFLILFPQPLSTIRIPVNQ